MMLLEDVGKTAYDELDRKDMSNHVDSDKSAILDLYNNPTRITSSTAMWILVTGSVVLMERGV